MTSPSIPGCTVQLYGKVPAFVKVRSTLVSLTTGMFAGAPPAPKITLCPRRSGDSLRRKRIVPPRRISALVGEKTLPGVKTSSVSGRAGTGSVGAASPPPQAESSARSSVPPRATGRARDDRSRGARGMGPVIRRVRQGTRRAPLAFRARVAGVAALVTIALAGGCSDGGATDPGPPAPSPNDPVAGAFALATVNTRALPFPIFAEAGFTLELTQSQLTLQAGGQFVLAITTVETVAGFPSTYQDTTRGSWTQNAGSVALNATDGTVAAATWDGRQLGFALDYDGQALAVVYRRNP